MKQSKSPTRQYYIFLGIFLPAILFFCSSGYLFASEGEIQETELWEKENLSYQISFSLINWQHNPNTDYMEIMLLLEDTQELYENNFEVSAYVRNNPNKKLSGVEIALQHEQILVIQIEKVPSDWDVIKINLADKTSSSSTVSFYCDYRTVKQSELLVPKEDIEYIVMGIEKQIEKTQLDITDRQNQIADLENDIVALEDDISSLENEKKWSIVK